MFRDENRPLPHDLEIERALLGAFIRDNRALEDVDNLDDSHFYGAVHRKMFSTIRKVREAGSVADTNTIRHDFASDTDIEVWDGTVGYSVMDYISTVEDHAAPREKIKSYANTLRLHATGREMFGIAERLMSAGLNVGKYGDPVRDIEVTEAALYNLKTQGVTSRSVVTIAEAANEGVDAAAAAYKHGTGLMGLSTGLKSLDGIVGGLAPGDLYIIAGRPAMGKSALAVNIAYEAARAGHAAAVFSLEMSSTQLGQRVVAAQSNIPAWQVRTGQISEDQFRALMTVAKAQKGVPLYIDEASGITVAQLARKIRRMASQYGIKLIVVDYLQLLHGTKKNQGNRVNEITEITVALKALAKELNMPLIVLSQLSRNLEQRDNKRPVLSDLRESGSIEQDADAVIFIYREEYYLNLHKPDEMSPEFSKWQARMAEVRGMAEVICAKNRHGPTGSAELTFNADTISFSDRG